MLKYLIIQLDDTSVSFCHYDNNKSNKHLIPLNVLNDAILWSMKENLTLQFLYPDYELPDEYKEAISKTYNASIVSSNNHDKELVEAADVVVFNSIDDLSDFQLNGNQAYVLRLTFDQFAKNIPRIANVLRNVNRLNVVITDIHKMSDKDREEYAKHLECLSHTVSEEFGNNHPVQFNLLTDRMLLESMNNCNAGIESITLAPDGRFYICPAFYLDGSQSVGDVASGPQIPNQQLYRLDHAPICRNCDAWQCRRCVWLNRHMTLEVNTPSREQCVASHLERNASRALLSEIRKLGTFLPGNEIPEIDYLDPFDKLNK